MHYSSKAVLAATFLLTGTSFADLNYNTTTYVGCYKSAGDLSKSDTFKYQSFGHCQEQCIPKSGDNAHPVMGLTKGSDCYCGMALPSEDDKVDQSQCNTGCSGFGTDTCGGATAFTVYLTGYDDSIGADAGLNIGSAAPQGSSSGGTSTTSQSPSVITKAGETIVVTAPGQLDANSGDKAANSGGSNKVGIAVGVVVGVVLFAALVGGGIFLMRHRKRKAIEEEYRRNQAINSFVTSDKPNSKGGSSISDQRLDPAMMQGRRQSDGSIADEVDYSRRILQVGRLYQHHQIGY